MENTAQILASNIRRLRAGRGWTQAELAERCDMGMTMILKLEHAKTNPSTKTIDAICRAFEVDPSQLFQGTRQLIPTFASAADFLSKFEGLPPTLQRMALSIVYQDVSYVRGIKLPAAVLAEFRAFLDPIPKAR